MSMALRGNLRASDEDREHVVDRLRSAAAEGRLAVHELEQRVATALRARTYAELDATVRDLPGAPRQGLARSAPRSVARTVSAHPALLILAIPVVMIAARTAIAGSRCCGALRRVPRARPPAHDVARGIPFDVGACAPLTAAARPDAGAAAPTCRRVRGLGVEGVRRSSGAIRRSRLAVEAREGAGLFAEIWPASFSTFRLREPHVLDVVSQFDVDPKSIGVN